MVAELLAYRDRLAPMVADTSLLLNQALDAGQTLARAVGAAGPGVTPEQVRDWFSTWMELGWFCRRK